MNLGEKLDELRKNILHDRSDLIAGDDDRLWSDATLLRYIKQGERRFARKTLCLRDSSTAAVTQVKLKSGVKTYALHPSVICMLSARYDTDDFDLQRAGHAIIAQVVPPEFLSFDPASNYTLPPGRPSAVYTDETLVYAGQGRVTLTLYPAPGADQDGKTVYLRVCRLPLTDYTPSSLQAEGELHEDFELDPLQWAAYLATSNHDGDAGSSVKSREHRAAFDQAVKDASKDIRDKIRVQISHRFGMGGFSYTR